MILKSLFSLSAVLFASVVFELASGAQAGLGTPEISNKRQSLPKDYKSEEDKVTPPSLGAYYQYLKSLPAADQAKLKVPQFAPVITDRSGHKGMSLEYETRKLEKPPQIPYVPEYKGQGARYQSGYAGMRQHAHDVFAHYLLKESPADVLHWYEGALKQSGWNVNSQLNQNSTAGMIHATLPSEHLHCQITAGPSYLKGYRCALNIKEVVANTMH